MEHDFIIITSDNKVGEKIPGIFPPGPRVTVPEFEMFSNPSIRISDVKNRRFKLIG